MNGRLLKEKIDQSGIKCNALASKMGIRRETLYNKISGKTEFLASEIYAITNYLGLSKKERDAIFFNHEVELKETKER